MDVKKILNLDYFNLVDHFDGNQFWLLTVDSIQTVSLKRNEDKNIKEVQGVVQSFIDTQGIKHVIGYFSTHQLAEHNAPDYKSSVHFFIDEKLFGETDKFLSVGLKKSFLSREIQVKVEEKIVVSLRYFWPFWREFFDADNFDFISADIAYRLAYVLKYSRPEWVHK